MGAPIRILHLDDNPSDAQLVAVTLEVEQDKFPTRLTYVQTRRMVEEVITEQRRIMGAEAGARVLVDVGDLPAVDADPILLRMVFTNLLSNAFKFTRTAAEPRITIAARRREGFIHFRIADNGVGSPKGHTEKLFKVFQRLHGAQEFEGTGIGLANVRKIVERHGGQVCGEGDEGKGRPFTSHCQTRSSYSPKGIRNNRRRHPQKTKSTLFNVSLR